MENLFNHAYPYLDEHELNLDWLIAKMKELNIKFDEFKVVNNITFSGQWDITKQYPAWTIVNDNNIGYVSIQPVPAGIVLTNSDYWVEVIDYSAQIAGLQNRVIALENTVGDASSGLVHDVDVLEDITDRLDNKYYLLIGDSYGKGYDPDSAILKGWCGYTKDLIEANGGRCYYSATIGGGYATPGKQWIDGLRAELDDIPDKDKITDVVILGGANDQASNGVTSAMLKPAISDMFTFLRTNFPKASLYTGTISAIYNALVNNTTNTYEQYTEYAASVGFKILDDLKLLYCQPGYLSSDGTHLSAAGYEALSPYVYTCITTGHVNFKFRYDVDITIDTSVCVDDGNQYKLTGYIHEDGITCNLVNKVTNAPGHLRLRSSTLPNSAFNAFSIDFHLPFPRGTIDILSADCFVTQDDTTDAVYIGVARILSTPSIWATHNITIFTPQSVSNWHTGAYRFYVAINYGFIKI